MAMAVAAVATATVAATVAAGDAAAAERKLLQQDEIADSAGPRVLPRAGGSDAVANSRALVRPSKLRQAGALFYGSFSSFSSYFHHILLLLYFCLFGHGSSRRYSHEKCVQQWQISVLICSWFVLFIHIYLTLLFYLCFCLLKTVAVVRCGR